MDNIIIILILVIIIIILVIYYRSTINNICYKEPEYFEYLGKENGPTILIIGATHGNEPAGFYGIKEFMNKLNKQERLLKASSNSIKALSEQNYSYLKKIKDIEKKFYLLPGRKVVRIFYKIFTNFLRVLIHKIIN